MGIGFHSKEARALLRDGRHWEQQSYMDDPQVGPTAADEAEAVEDRVYERFDPDTVEAYMRRVERENEKFARRVNERYRKSYGSGDEEQEAA